MWLSTSRRFWFRLTIACIAACSLMSAPAAAQIGTQPGQAILPLAVITGPGMADIRFEAPSEFRSVMTSAGGVTLFAASVPNGPPLVRLPFLPPFPEPATDTDVLYGWGFPGVPSGTYWVTVILGVVNTPNVADAAWTRLVVPGSCGSAPGMGLVSRNLGGVVSDSVRLFLGAHGGCATGYRVEVGTSPGAANVAVFEQTDVLLSADGVPPGSYYVRVAGRNQFGLGRASAILPVSVPDCSSQVLDEIDGFHATVVGQQVTLAWTPPATPPGRPVTYYEIGLLNGIGADEPIPRILLPTTAATFSATVASGTYVVSLFAGNACGSWQSDGLIITVP